MCEFSWSFCPGFRPGALAPKISSSLKNITILMLFNFWCVFREKLGMVQGLNLSQNNTWSLQGNCVCKYVRSQDKSRTLFHSKSINHNNILLIFCIEMPLKINAWSTLGAWCLHDSSWSPAYPPPRPPRLCSSSGTGLRQQMSLQHAALSSSSGRNPN